MVHIPNALRLLLPLFFVILTSVEAQTRLNIYVADPRGGRGDIAANFLMARRLLELRPNSEINVLVPRQSLDVARFLEPDLAKGKSSLGSGIKIIEHGPGITVPKADAVLSYSSSGDPVYGAVADSAPRILYFLEPDYDQLRQVYYPTWNPSEEPTAHKTFFLNTGPSNLGNYVTPDGSPRQKFVDLRARLAAETGIPMEEIPNLENGYLAMGYASNSDITRAYMEHGIEFARRILKRNGDQPILFLVNRKGWADKDYKIKPLSDKPNKVIRLGTQVYLLPYERLSLGLSEALYGASDIPPLATGDASQSMAMQFGRAFFYELQGWKQGSYSNHLNGLMDASGLILLLNNSFTFRVVENAEFQSAQRNRPHGGLTIEADEHSLRQGPEFWAMIDRATAAVRKYGSLAENTWTIVDRLMEQPPAKTFSAHKVQVDALESFIKINCPSAVQRLAWRKN